ncbi:hypothetical protein, partial [Sphingopyxis sp.]|uniref:hypothetical protein n=1 Tax=Sphingopyxis sp. TaxID=1908224 RepID=UPI0035B215BC
QAMNPRKMSEVLAAMSPDVAGRLTVELAARSLNAQAPAPAPAAAPAATMTEAAPAAAPAAPAAKK